MKSTVTTFTNPLKIFAHFVSATTYFARAVTLLSISLVLAVSVASNAVAATYTYKPALTGYSDGYSEPGQSNFFSSAKEVCDAFNQPAASFNLPSVSRVGGVQNCSLNGGTVSWYNNAGGGAPLHVQYFHD